MNTFFISDTHFGHFNIIKYCNRPFKTLKEMDDTIIKNWNSRVKKEDTVYFLGDFCFNKSSEASQAPKRAKDYYRDQLNGNIIFFKGSHDKNNGVKSPIKNMTIHYAGVEIFLTHEPKDSKLNCQYNFCGHTHGKYGKFQQKENTIIIDLSVENWNYTPVTVNEIFSALNKWKKGK